MNRIIAVFSAFLMFTVSLSAQSKVDLVRDKGNAKRDEIIKKDEEHRQRILKKFYDFQAKVLKMAPGMDLDIPVDPVETDDIKDQNLASKYEKINEFDAWAADSYMLRSLPYDGVKEFTAAVKRGDRVKVLMKPDMKGKKEYPSITKEWFLIRTAEGAEGYIPADMLLKKRPEKDKKSGENGAGTASGYACGSNFGPLEHEGMFILARYGSDSDSDNEVKKFKEGTKLRVTTGSLKVRSESSLDSDSIGSLYSGNIVEVIECSSNTDYYGGHTSNWIKVKAGDFEGWVFAYYLAEAGGNESAGGSSGGSGGYVMTDFDKGMELYVKPDILRVRDAPDDLGTVLFSLQNKDEVEVVDIESELVSLGGKKSRWVKIKYNEYEGWVFGAFLSTDKNVIEQGDDINNMFQAPVTEGDYFISSKFGKRMLKGKVSNHTGIDLAAPCGTDVLASADGAVVLVVENYRNCSSCSYGSYIIVEHKNGFRSLYGHLSKVKVKMGQKVNSGEVIGAVGNTGHSYGCHLHFEIRAYEEYVDPNSYLHP